MNKNLISKTNNIVVIDPEIRNGIPCFKNTRIPVNLVLDFISKGWSINSLDRLFPELDKEDVRDLVGLLSHEFKADEKSKT